MYLSLMRRRTSKVPLFHPLVTTLRLYGLWKSRNFHVLSLVSWKQHIINYDDVTKETLDIANEI